MSVGRKVRVLDPGSGRWVTRVMKDGVIKDGGRWWHVEREGGEYVIGTEADDPYTRSMYHGGSARKNPTKAQKREKSSNASVQRRVAVALAKFLKQANPAMKTTGASVQRLKGGVIKITPIKANAGGTGWTVDAFHGGGGMFRSKKAAMEHARRLREANRQAGNVGPVRVVKLGGKR